MSNTKVRAILQLLPNLLTTIGLFLGFYAIILAANHFFYYAALAIIAAGIADTLDGRVARLVNSSSEFGVQYDTLVDTIAFAVAPALVMYFMFLDDLFYVGIGISFFYVACGTFRLARFNMAATTEDKSAFKGLPSTAAAGMMAVTIWLFAEYHQDGLWMISLAALITVLIALLMISAISYTSINGLERKYLPFVALGILGFIIAAMVFNWPEALFAVGASYVFGVPLFAMIRRCKMRKRDHP